MNFSNVELVYICCTKSMQGRRKKQEDSSVVINDFISYMYTLGYTDLRVPNHLQPRLFDGHMGNLASIYCSKHIPIEIAKELNKLFSSEISLEKDVSSTLNKNVSKQCFESNIINSMPNTTNENEIVSNMESCEYRAQKLKNNLSESRLLVDDNSYVNYPNIHKVSSPNLNIECENTCVLSENENVIQLSTEHNDFDPNIIAEMLINVCKNVDNDFLKIYRLNKDGTTLSIVLILGCHVFSCWLGDSRMVLGSLREMTFEDSVSKTPKFKNEILYDQGVCHIENNDLLSKWITSNLSYDHKPSCEHERNRIIAANGAILKINGIYRVAKSNNDSNCQMKQRCNSIVNRYTQNPAIALAISRSIGDRDFKENIDNPLISSYPEIRYFMLDTNYDKVLIVACDGIWDVLTEQEVVSIFQSMLSHVNIEENHENAVSEVIKLAFRKGSQDNLTIITAFPFLKPIK